MLLQAEISIHTANAIQSQQANEDAQRRQEYRMANGKVRLFLNSSMLPQLLIYHP